MSHSDPTVETLEMNDIEELVVENEMMLVEINSLRRRVSELEGELATKSQEVEAMRELHGDLHRDKDRLDEELTQLHDQHEALKHTFESQVEEMTILRETLDNCLVQLEAQHSTDTERSGDSSRKIEQMTIELQRFFANRQASVEGIRRCVVSAAISKERIRPEVEKNILTLRKSLEASRRIKEDHQDNEETLVHLAKSNFGAVVAACAETMIEMLTQFADAMSPLPGQTSQEPSSSRNVAFWQKR